MATDLTGFMPEETGAEQLRVESFFKPNLALIDKVLATRQTMYNTNLDAMAKAKAKVDEVNALEGFDKQEWFKMQEEYDKEIEGIMSLYEGDLSKANAELYGFSTKVGKDFGIHGKATAINERALGYMMNKKELDTRLAKGEIEYAQYWKLNKELDDTRETGIGLDPKNYISWRKINPMDAVNFDKFAKDFLTDYKASVKLKGYTMQQRGDFIEFVKTGARTISYEEVMSELSAAYNNAAEKTGQLRDQFDYHVYRNDIKLTREKYIEGYTTKISEHQERINKLNTLKGKELQEYMNTIGGNVNPNGIATAETVATKQALLDQSENYIKGYNQRIEVVSDDTKFNQQQIEALYYKEYTDAEIRRLSDPYARVKSMNEDILEHDIHRDPNADLRIGKALKDYEKLLEEVAPISNSTPGETLTVESILKAQEGIKTKKSELADMENRLKTDNRLNAQEKIDLQNKIDAKKTEIYNIENNVRNLEEKMEENGYQGLNYITIGAYADVTTTNEKLIYSKELKATGVGNDGIDYIQRKETLLSGLTDKQKANIFNGETDDEKIIAKFLAGNTDVSWRVGKTLEMAKLYNDPSPEVRTEMRERLQQHLKDKVNASNGGVTEWISIGMANSQTFYNNMKNQYTKEVTNFTENSNITHVTETTQTISVDPNSKGFINQQTKAWKNDYENNPAGWVNAENTQFDLSGKKFYDKDGKEAKEDKSKSTFILTSVPINGKFAAIIYHKDAAGNSLYDKKGNPIQSMVYPKGQNNDGGIKSTVNQIGLSEMNWAKTDFTQEKGKYLNEAEQANADKVRETRYLDGLQMAANANYAADMQSKGIHYMPTGGNGKLISFGGSSIVIHKSDYGTFSLYMPNPDGSPNFRQKISLSDPSIAYQVSVGRNVIPPPNKESFGSIEDISKSLYFNLNILRDFPKQDWEDLPEVPVYNSIIKN